MGVSIDLYSYDYEALVEGISYDLRRVDLREKIPDSSKKYNWELESRFELVME
ncbi:hypothetical protein G9M73_13905 [Listeria monocytogenes]|uniref:hypothetical protein n=1 Tax=Listeria monocytogenes TaxID=1639 RepID=UPI0001975EC0|nr:hypothetical protein [Listeria monocytogenes]AEO26647.1 hypothetical protein LMKG_00005 [Listeria monocytogenes FSL R2-561]EHL2522959.1 hypothetical protein [Listeria monocytogenes]EHL2568477.1 hypothetical protein [Listeria monocytogenes]EHL2641782.1 hypothetical protein [Listeria monocytogenes]EHL2657145.1 hypothetical protein [Listeria monocytogenes]